MPECLCFLRVADIAQTIKWYEQLGFSCLGTHQEPGCELDWAMLSLDGANFMLYPEISGQSKSVFKDSGLYFNMESIDQYIEKLKAVGAEIIEITQRTEYDRKEVVFKDLNHFQVTISCEPTK